MAKRWRRVYVFDGEVELPQYDGGFEVVGRNERWTTLAPNEPTKWDSLPVSKLRGVPVFDMWFDEADGVVARLHQYGFVAGVYSLPVVKEGAYTPAELADAFATFGIFTRAQVKELKTAGQGGQDLRGLDDGARPREAPRSARRGAEKDLEEGHQTGHQGACEEEDGAEGQNQGESVSPQASISSAARRLSLS